MRPVSDLSTYPMKHPIPDEQREEEDWQFYAEPLQAWRAWRVVCWDEIIVLQSITYKVNWLPRQEFVAECMTTNPVPRAYLHAPPDINHGCGIYSLKNEEDAMMWTSAVSKYDTVAYGKVSIWGHCLNYTKGYLSEYAYPSLICVPPNVNKEDIQKKLTLDAEELVYEIGNTYRVEAVTA